MAGVLQHLRSSTLDKRPNPASMVDGQVAINYASGSPGMFFKDSNGDLVKVGPVHVGATAPNVSPASGGTAGNSKGEQWLDTSGGTYVFKIWDGSAWRSEAGEFVNSTGDTMTGSLIMGQSADIIFEGSVDDGFETTLTVANPTADRTITLPNVTGTVVTTGDSGSVTSTMIANGTIVDADVNAGAAIAGTKVSPNFGSQTVQTTGVFSAAGGSQSAPSIAFTGDTDTGIYSPSADQVAISTNGTGQLFVDASGRVGIGGAPAQELHVYGATDSTFRLQSTSDNRELNISCGHTGFDADQIIGQSSSLRLTANGFENLRLGGSSIIGYTSGSERLRITSTGLVGIGTSSPAQQLDVVGNFKLSGSAIIGPAAGSYGQITADKTTVFNSADVPASTTLYLTNSSGGTEGNGSYGPSLGFGRINSSLRPGGAIATVQTSADADQCGLAFLTHSASVTTNALAEAVRITHDGNVGIGTTSPGSPLQIGDGTGFQRALITGANCDLLLGPAAGATFGTASDGASLVSTVSKNVPLIVGTIPAQPLVFGTNNQERARIDSSGRLLVGTSNNIASSIYGGTVNPALQIAGTGTSANSLAQYAFNGVTGHVLGRSNNATVGQHTIVAADNDLGYLSFVGSDGSAFIEAARVWSEVDGTPGANDMPGRLVFSTTADGASSPTERLRITSDGVRVYNQPAPAEVNATATLTVANLKAGIITSTSAAATDMTLPTGTLTEGGFSGLYDNFIFEWSVINTGPSLVRVLAGTAHTIVGSGSVATGTSARFASRRTAANTFVTYRLS